MFALKCLMLCVLLNVGCSFAARIGEPCINPNQKTIGRCLPKNDCPQYQSLVQSDDVPRHFLKKLNCETTPRSAAVKTVCCTTDQYDIESLATDDHRLGDLTDINEFPWSALLIYKSTRKYVCGGALISDRYVLTAAHCLVGREDDPDRIVKSVRLGEYNTETDIDCIFDGNSKECADPAVDLAIEKLIIHENYQPNLKSKRNDIALIRLAKNVTFSTYIQPISLPHDKIKSDLTIGAVHVIAGWGRTRMFYETHGIVRSPIKLKLKIPIADFESCAATYSSYHVHLDASQICAGGIDRHECLREGGYALMYYNREHGVWVVSGITSLGLNHCYVAGVPDVYTNVETYVDWIQSKIV